MFFLINDCTLWSLSCKLLRVIEVAINKIFRKVWNLPFKSHAAIVHCVSHIFPISNLINNSYTLRPRDIREIMNPRARL